ncbi:MAG: hypothetical protein CL765_03710 [Chloroflexi bacterium]|nr:hypothetical protein [Chloroflexota bacterium]
MIVTYITGLALRRGPVTILAFVLILAAGLFTFVNLPVEVLPRVQFPLMTVNVDYPNAGSEEVLKDVTYPLEQHLNGLDNLETIQSTSIEGTSILLLFYEYGSNMEQAQKELESRLVSMELPDGATRPEVGGIDPGSEPILQLSLTSDILDFAAMSAIVDAQIEPAVNSVEGVNLVSVAGVQEFQLLVQIDPTKLAALQENPLLKTPGQISISRIAKELRESNFSVPSGFQFDGSQMISVRTINYVDSIEEIQNIPLIILENEVINLGDVAEILLAPSSQNSISRTNGYSSLGISVTKEPNANTVDVSKAALQKVRDVSIIEGIEVVEIYNAGPEIESQLNTLKNEGMYGFIFAVAGVFLFLLNVRKGFLRGLTLSLRPTSVIALTIPISILGGVLLMGFTDLTLNIMTLGGLAISVGRVVDDSIVVLENVYRHMQRGESPKVAAFNATKEVAAPITASTLTTIVVFAPLGFIQGLVGSFFFPFCIAVSFALISSLVVSVTLVPVVGAFILRPGDLSDEGGDSSLSLIQRIYKPTLQWALGHKLASVGIAFALCLASLGLLRFIPVIFFPTGPDRYISIDIFVPPTSTPDQSNSAVLVAEQELENLRKIGQVENYLTTIGDEGLASFPGAGSPSSANIFVNVDSSAPAGITDALRFSLSPTATSEYKVTEGSGGPPEAGLELRITAGSLEAVSKVNQEILEALKDVSSVENVESDLTGTRPEMVIKVNSESASRLGLTPREVASRISEPMKGQMIGNFSIEGKDVEVLLTVQSSINSGMDSIDELIITGPLGSAPAKELIETFQQETPITIARTDGRRSATIRGEITAEDTRKVGMEISDIALMIEKRNPGVSIVSGGIFADIEEGFRDIFLAMAISIILVYLVMVGSLGSLRNPFVILFSLPLAAIGALVGLAVTGSALGLPSMMGLLLLIGLVVTNAIVLISFVQQLQDQGMTVRESLIEGGLVRLRPILMTAVTTGAALIPLAVFVGDEGGGIIGADLAIVVIGGLASSTFLTLLVIPIIYEFMHETMPKFLRLRR